MKLRLSAIILFSLLVQACANTPAANKKKSAVQAQANKSSAAPKVTTTPADRAMIDLLGRVDQLQREMQQLRGQLEEQAYAINDLKKRHSAVNADFEQRMQMLEMQGSGSVDTGSALSGEPAGMPKSVMPPEEPLINKKVTGIEKQVYLAAYENLRSGHYSQAISMFKQVIFDYPDGEYADNAQYWLGEVYKVNQDIPAAKEAFNLVIVNYPDSPKVPDAMLKLAYIEIEQQNPNKAREYLLKIIDDYRDTTAAHLAETKLMQLDGASFQ